MKISKPLIKKLFSLFTLSFFIASMLFFVFPTSAVLTQSAQETVKIPCPEECGHEVICRTNEGPTKVFTIGGKCPEALSNNPCYTDALFCENPDVECEKGKKPANRCELFQDGTSSYSCTETTGWRQDNEGNFIQVSGAATSAYADCKFSCKLKVRRIKEAV